MYAILITRTAGYSPLGHYFPADSRLLKAEGQTVLFDTQHEAEDEIVRLKSQCNGYTQKTYRAIFYEALT